MKMILKNKFIWIFLAIFLVGALFRVYNFSGWLRFNMDQSRDTILIEESIAENKLPEFGPKAGGTDFKLGPVFYHFQFISGKIFGTEPEKLAYPDLVFSLLSIGLIFLLAKIYFNSFIALSVTWLYVISYFVVKYSRFAWNPNSTPFFVMLFIYSVYRLSTSQDKKTIWAILTGISLGVCVQLHTSLLVILPLVSIFLAFILLKKEKIKKTAIILILMASILVNAPQIIGEIKTNGSNIKDLFQGVEKKNERNDGLGANLLLNLSCHINSNNFIISSLGNESECDYNYAWKTFKKLDGKRMTLEEKTQFIVLAILSLVFFFGGYFLLFKKTFSEKNKNKKLLLIIISSYVIFSFIFYIFWANELAVRFFLPLSFIPFIIVGFWLEFFSLKFKKGFLISIFIVIAISFFSLQKISHTYKYLQYGGEDFESDFSYMTLGEGRYIVDFIKNNSDKKENYIDAPPIYLFKSFRSLEFLAEKKHLEISRLDKKTILNAGDKIFYFKNAEDGCQISEKMIKKYKIEKCSLFRQFAIFVLKVK